MPASELLNASLNRRIRTVATQRDVVDEGLNKTKLKQDFTEKKALLERDDFLSQYDLGLARQRVVGSLGWDNLEPLRDPDKIGDEVITARAMEAQNFAALDAWIVRGAIQDALSGLRVNESVFEMVHSPHLSKRAVPSPGEECGR